MRKIIFIFAVMILGIQDSIGQVRLGPKAGITLSQQNFDSEYLVWQQGFEFGALAMVPIKEEIYLQAEFLVTQKGFREEFGSKESFNELTATYWQLPVSIQYRRGNRVEYYVNAGVYVARWQSGKLRSRIDVESQIVEEDYEFTKNYNLEGFKDNRSDFGVMGSLGVIYPLSINHLMLDIRYNHGLVDVNDLQNEPDGYEARTNKNLVISLAILFYL